MQYSAVIGVLCLALLASPAGWGQKGGGRKGGGRGQAGQGRRASLELWIVDSGRKPLEGVEVSVLGRPEANESSPQPGNGDQSAPASVVGKGAEMQVLDSGRTDAGGRCQLRRLAPGEVRLRVSQEGYQTLDQILVLEAGRTTSVTIRLAAAGAASTSQAAEDRSAMISQTISETNIENMPLGDRRAMNMVAITGASVFVGYQSGGKASFSLGGGRAQSQMFTIDGGNGQGMRLGGGAMEFDPPVESIREVRVMTNGYSAEHGASAGGVIAARIKSGTNRYSGSLFEYVRNDLLDAAGYFAPVSGNEKLKPPLRYHVFGGTIGGPIRRNRTFFFLSYEGSRRLEGDTRQLTVPTLDQRAGNFSNTLNTRGMPVSIFDPATTRFDGMRYRRDPFPGNVLPATRIDAVAANLLPLYPAPNVAPSNITGANNFLANGAKKFVRDHITFKVDHNLTANARINARYVYNTNDQKIRSIFPNPAAENQPENLSSQHQGFLSWTQSISAGALLDIRITYSRRESQQNSLGTGGDWPSRLGLTGVAQNAFPRFQASGFSPLGANNQQRWQSPVQQFQWLPSLGWRRGAHSLKLGFEYRPSSNREADLQTVSGSFTFNPLATGQPGQNTTGHSFASLLLGLPHQFTERQTDVLDRSSRYLAAFFQDDWDVTPTFTWNYGLRWEVDTPMRDRNNRINGFDLLAINPVSGTPGVVRFAGVSGWPDTPYRGDYNNFGPRAGFAWRPFGLSRTVVRAGYGVFFAHPFDRSVTTSASLGFEQSARLVSPDNGITPPLILARGVPPLSDVRPPLDEAYGAKPLGVIPDTLVSFFDRGRRSGYAQQYHFGIQHRLPGEMILDVSFLGNSSHKLAGEAITINQIRPEQMGPGASQELRPYPQFSDVRLLTPSFGNSSYHAGMLRLEKRLSGGLQLLTTYTWSKFLSDVDEGEGGGAGSGAGYSDLYNRRADWGPSGSDIRHRFTWSSIYQLPFGDGGRYLASHPLRILAKGWTVGAIATLQSGPPFTVTTQVNTTNAFSAGPLRADVLGNPNLPVDQRSIYRWFDTSAFEQPAAYTFGNQGVNLLRADGLVNFDFSILRNFNLAERFRLQFRGELFNAFNHPDFDIPGRVLGQPEFGIVNHASSGRRVQLGLRLTF